MKTHVPAECVVVIFDEVRGQPHGKAVKILLGNETRSLQSTLTQKVQDLVARTIKACDEKTVFYKRRGTSFSTRSTYGLSSIGTSVSMQPTTKTAFGKWLKACVRAYKSSCSNLAVFALQATGGLQRSQYPRRHCDSYKSVRKLTHGRRCTSQQ